MKTKKRTDPEPFEKQLTNVKNIDLALSLQYWQHALTESQVHFNYCKSVVRAFKTEIKRRRKKQI